MQFSYSTFATHYSRWVKSAAITQDLTEGSQTTSTKTGERKKHVTEGIFFKSPDDFIISAIKFGRTSQKVDLK